MHCGVSYSLFSGSASLYEWSLHFFTKWFFCILITIFKHGQFFCVYRSKLPSFQLSSPPPSQVLDLDKKSHLTAEELKKYMTEEGRYRVEGHTQITAINERLK